MPEQAPQRPAAGVVEPVGYAVTQFVAAIAVVIGIGLAPDGLLLLAAAILLSVIDLRRFREANPGLLPDTPEEFKAPIGRVLYRYSALGTVALLVLAVLAIVLVAQENDRAAAIGPGLVGGVLTLGLNWRLKLALAKAAAAAEQTRRDDAFRPGEDERDG